MVNAIIDLMRASVRPLTTLGLVAAFVAASFYDKDVAALLGPPAMLVLGFWYKERSSLADRGLDKTP